MRVVNMSRIEKNINTNRQEVNAKLRSERSENPRIKRERTRSADESRALTEVAKASVERAKREGKMKMIGKRKMYYDPTE